MCLKCNKNAEQIVISIKKQDLLNNAQNFYKGRKMVINAFKDKIFPFNDPGEYPQYSSEEDILARTMSPDVSLKGSSSSSSSNSSNNKLDKLIIDSKKELDPNLVERYFYQKSLKELLKYFKFSRSTTYGNAKQVLVRSILATLKSDIRNVSEDGVENKRLNLLASLFEKSLDSNAQINGETAEKKGEVLKIITPKQIITRLPILLSQLEAGHNSEKLENEIIQLVYSLYR